VVKRKKETKSIKRNYFEKANPFYGKHHTEKTKTEQGELMKEKWKDPKYRENQIKKRKGKHYSIKTEFKKGFIPWHKDKKGIHLSPKTEFKKGNIPWNKDKNHPKYKKWIKIIRERGKH